MKIIGLALLSIVLSGCSAFIHTDVTSDSTPSADVILLENDKVCLTKSDRLAHNCEFSYWVRQWVIADNTPWPDRKAQINALGGSLHDKLLRIVKSLPVDTPYQDRLRAQALIKEVSEQLTDPARELITTIIGKPNQQMLEFESAITILSRVNTRQANTIETLKDELDIQQKKVEELLQIEASLMDKSRSNQQ